MAIELPDNLTGLDDEELESLWDDVAREALETREANKKVAAEVNRRATQRNVRETYDRLSDTERTALLQMVEAEGIESQESVGNDG